MLNIKKTIAVSRILFNNLVLLSLFIMFCWLGSAFSQIEGDSPQPGEFDPRHPFTSFKGRPLEPRENGVSPSAISKNVEFVGATGGAVLDVFVQDN